MSVRETAATVVGRLAPSPTGAQHIGNARSYLIAWLSIRSCAGTLLLRIEDIDSPRVKPDATEQIFADLRWLGLDWDGEPLVQSTRIASYRTALSKLQELELVYPCTCTRSDIHHAASAPHAENEGLVYPGTCAGRIVADAGRLNEKYCWRFRLADGEHYFDDRFSGTVKLSNEQIGGDFVVWKNDDTPAYQLAVVVDDADFGVTEVVRGDDLLVSTPRQLALYAALELNPPQFLHVPLVVGVDGRRLAKRHGDTRLESLRSAGIRAEQLIGLLAWSCGWLDEVRDITAQELLPRFTLASIPHQPFVLAPQLLAAIGYDAGQ